MPLLPTTSTYTDALAPSVGRRRTLHGGRGTRSQATCPRTLRRCRRLGGLELPSPSTAAAAAIVAALQLNVSWQEISLPRFHATRTCCWQRRKASSLAAYMQPCTAIQTAASITSHHTVITLPYIPTRTSHPVLPNCCSSSFMRFADKIKGGCDIFSHSRILFIAYRPNSAMLQARRQ